MTAPILSFPGIATLAATLASCLAIALPPAGGQDVAAPEVVRLRVPGSTLSEWFPGRAGLTELDRERFEQLVRSAREAIERGEASRLVDPIRIEHRIRLEGGELVGTSALRFLELDDVRWASLWPWSPAVESVSPSSCALIHRDEDGRAFLRLDFGKDGGGRPDQARTVELSWRLRPRVEAGGRIFDLELVEGPATALILDLPEGVTPSGPPGYRAGPEPAEEPGRRRWRFDGPGGAVVLRLRSAPDPERPSGPWIGGATLVELDGEGPSAALGGAARWMSSWEVDPGPEGHRPLEIALGPGVGWQEVTGPEGAVAGVEAVSGPEGTRLTVRWRDGLTGPTRLVLAGLAAVDDPGNWAVPLAEPIGAQWTGGPVIVRLGRAWSLVGCRERAGRRLDLEDVAPEAWQAFQTAVSSSGTAGLDGAAVPSPSRADGATVLAFFADRPSPVAELELAPGRVVASASVRGTVRLRDGADAMEAEVDVMPTPEGASLVLLELSPGWEPEAVRLADGQPVPRWEQEIGDGGRRIIRVHLPGRPAPVATLAGPRRPALVVTAFLTREEPRAMALPRLRPIGPAVAEERWAILGGPGVALRPVEAEGLAWLDPTTPTTEPSPQGEARALLAWRWTAAEGRGRAVQETVPARPSAVVDQRATIAGGRLTIDWVLRLDARGEAIRSLPYRIVPRPSGPDGPGWMLEGDDGRASRPVQPVDIGGGVSELRLPREAADAVTLAGRLELPWDGEGPLPMLDLPRRFEARGTLTLRVEPSLACDVRGDLAFRDLEPSQAVTTDAEPATGQATRLAGAYSYDGRPGSLVVRTTTMPASPSDGAILRADLETWATADGATRNRLSLDVAADGAATLGVELPAGSTTFGAWCDGRPAGAFVRGTTTRIPLPPPGSDGRATARPCRIVLDFERPGDGETEPGRPRFSMPCLSFSWRLAMPADRAVSAVGMGLIPADPGPGRRGWLPGLAAGRLPSPTAGEREMLDRLDERAAAAAPADGQTLGDLLARWDVVRWPLVVDRAALESRGLGPRSALPTAGGAAGLPIGDGPTTGTARSVLDPIGLLVVPMDTVLLVTTLDEVPRFASNPLGSGDDRGAWIRALREAVAWGADRSARFRTIERWRATGGGVAAVDPDMVGPRSEAHSVRRFVAAGWPSQSAGVRTVDRWPWLVAGLVPAALLLLGAWVRLPGRGWAVVRGVLLLAVATGLALVASRAGPGPAAAAVLPFYAAAVGAVLAPLRRRTRSGSVDRAGSTLSLSHGTASRAGSGAVGMLVLVAALCGAQSVSMPEGDGPIVAFLPDSGAGDDDPSPDATAWMRDADLRRLEDAASPPDVVGPAPWPLVGAVAAEHSLRPDGDDAWALVSRLTLHFEVGGSATWSLPIDRPTMLEANFDGQPRPVLIAPSADRATVAIDGPAGTHELVIRQRVRPEDDAGGRRLRLRVNPVATSTLDVAEPPDATAPTLARSLGPMSIGADGGIRAAIGPIDRVEVGWGRPVGDGSAGASSRVEGLLLWRALPSSDQLDALLTVRGPAPARELWFAIEPGVAVRSARASGSIVEGSRIVADDGDRWVARIDPPLPDGGVLRVELWRPRGDDDGEGPRGLPRLEPLGVARYDGRVALMRPGSWDGRLGTRPGDLSISEQEFEQDWGPLPRGDALDPAGAARFVGPPAVAVPLGPSPPRLRVEPTLQLDLDAGRWEWRVAAEVADLDGRSIRSLDVRLPADLVLIDAEAPGLTAWDRPAPDRLRLRFDGPAGSTRQVTLGGWLPLPADPMDPGPLVVDRPLPWPGWPGASVESGLLLLSSPSTAVVEYRVADGTPTLADRLATSNNRRRYEPIPVDEPGLLHVESFPAVSVELWSQLILGGRSAHWEAMVRLQVTGGPADRIGLILPGAWAEAVEYELDGLGPVAVHDLGDHVEIDPGRPVWGTAELRIRSTLPLDADEPLSYPALVPWGRGNVSRNTVAVAFPPNRGPGLEFSGLEPADSATEDQLSDAFAPLPPDARREAFAVRREGWSMVVRPPSTDPGADPSPEADGAHVDLAEIACAIAPDGTVRGHASYQLRPPVGPFLTLRAPRGASALAAVVDGRAVRPRVDGRGRWVVPLGDGPARRVELAWLDPTPPDARRGRRLTVPQPLQDGATVLATLSCDEGDTVEASGGQTVPSPAAAPLVERLERAGDRLRDRLEALSFGAAAVDRDALLAEVARFLTLQRQAERSAYWAALMRPDTAEVVRQRGPLRRIANAREELDAALLAANLPDLIALATPSADPGPPTQWLSPILPGVPRHFRAEAEADRPISFDWSPGDDG